MIIAIDGPAGSGKSTVARLLAARLHIAYLDTGAMYRSLALAALQNSVSLDDEHVLHEVAQHINISFKTSKGGDQQVFLDGKEVTEAIRQPKIDAVVSKVSSYPSVRDELTKRQKEIAATQDVVLEGRDTTTVVCPNATLKVFLKASPKQRAIRRVLQYHPHLKKESITSSSLYKETLSKIVERDASDENRAVAPLVCAPDALVIDSSNATIEEVLSRIITALEHKKKA